jgi:hypothetical protein
LVLLEQWHWELLLLVVRLVQLTLRLLVVMWMMFLRLAQLALLLVRLAVA